MCGSSDVSSLRRYTASFFSCVLGELWILVEGGTPPTPYMCQRPSLSKQEPLQLKMRMIGLTGGIASGKSTVSKEFQSLGVPIIDADKIAHAALRKGTIGYRRVVAAFGTGILQEDGQVDRARLGNIIFSDPSKRKTLNSALSFPISVGLYWEILKHFFMGSELVVLDIPLLFEAKLNKITNPVIVVWLDALTQEERLMKRDGIAKELAINKINAQLPLDWKRENADIVIDNSGDLDATKAQVHQVWEQINSTSLSWTQMVCSRNFMVAVIFGISLFGLLGKGKGFM